MEEGNIHLAFSHHRVTIRQYIEAHVKLKKLTSSSRSRNLPGDYRLLPCRKRILTAVPDENARCSFRDGDTGRQRSPVRTFICDRNLPLRMRNRSRSLVKRTQSGCDADLPKARGITVDTEQNAVNLDIGARPPGMAIRTRGYLLCDNRRK